MMNNAQVARAHRRLCFEVMVGIFLVFFAFSTPALAAESPIIRTVLNNGIVLLTRTQDRTDVIAISFILRIGVFDEEERKVGFRALAADLLLEKICSEESPDGIRTTELMGVMSSAETTPDYIIFNFVTTPRHYKKVIELIARGIGTAAIDESLFKKEKASFVERTKESRGAFSTIYGIFLQNFYRYHPYKLSEDINLKGLESTPREKVEEFLKAKLSSDRIVFAMAGNVNAGEMKALIEKNFTHLTPMKSSRVEVQWEPHSIEKEIFLSSLSQMSYLILGFPAPCYGSPDFPAMKVLTTILGEGLNSRLWVELREKRGLAYQLGSFYPELEGPSHILIYVVTQPQNVILSRRLIVAEIEKIKVQGVSAKEVADAKEKISGNYLLARESSRGQASNMAISEVIGGQYSLDLTMQKKVDDVTMEGIKKAINVYFSEPTLLVVRPPGAFYIDWFR